MVSTYLQALWFDMVARMSGLASLAFTVVGVFSQAFSGALGGSRARTFCWIAAAICFVYANYRTWLDEHRKAVSSQPDFQLTIERLDFEYLQSVKKTAYLFAVTLINRGAPSITTTWKALYEVGNSQEVMEHIHLADKWLVRYGYQQLTLYPKDFITTKTAEQRVETGDAKHGRLLFFLPGDRTEQVRAAQFKVQIALHDFRGQRVIGTFTPNALPLTEIGVFPGEHGEIITPPELAPDIPKA